jgi:hypothetical protein
MAAVAELWCTSQLVSTRFATWIAVLALQSPQNSQAWWIFRAKREQLFQRFASYCAAVRVVAERGGVLSLAGVDEAWLSFAAWMMTVLVEVEVRPFLVCGYVVDGVSLDLGGVDQAATFLSSARCGYLFVEIGPCMP